MVLKTSGDRLSLLRAMSQDISDKAGVPQEISQEILDAGVVCTLEIPSNSSVPNKYTARVGSIDHSRPVSSEEGKVLWPIKRPILIARFLLGEEIDYEVDYTKDKLILPEDCNYLSLASPPASNSMDPQHEARYLASSKEDFICLPRQARRLGKHSLAKSLYEINEFLQRSKQ